MSTEEIPMTANEERRSAQSGRRMRLTARQMRVTAASAQSQSKRESSNVNCFALLKKVRACDLFDGRLEAFGVREKIVPDETTEQERCLTDGRNHLWVYINDDD